MPILTLPQRFILIDRRSYVTVYRHRAAPRSSGRRGFQLLCAHTDNFYTRPLSSGRDRTVAAGRSCSCTAAGR